jgi:hypothetical protein
VTDDALPNPWDTLPSYWTNEVNYIRALNQSVPATQLKLVSLSNRVPLLQISGAPGTYELQATSNFANWFPLTNVNAGTSSIAVPDPGASNSAWRFYRTRQ